MTAQSTPDGGSKLAATARHIATEVAGPAAAAVDTDGRFPTETFDALRAAGLLSALIPQHLGGMGASITEVAETVEILGKACANSAMILAMHHIQVASLVRHGRTDWMQDFIRQAATEQMLLASATTERGIGGDVRSSSCAVATHGDRFTLEKHAPVISYGRQADAVLATARAHADSPPNDQVLAVLPTIPGLLTQETTWNALGFRGTCSDGFFLSGGGHVDQILSDPYDIISAHTMLPTAHTLWASVWLGLATSAVDTARTYVRKDARKQPGSTPPTAVHLAELMTTVDQFRSLVRARLADYEAAWDDPDTLNSIGFALQMNTLKVSASTMVAEIVARAMTICGIGAYLNDSPYSLGRHLRDAHGAALMVNNDRIVGAAARMLLVYKGES